VAPPCAAVLTGVAALPCAAVRRAMVQPNAEEAPRAVVRPYGEALRAVPRVPQAGPLVQRSVRRRRGPPFAHKRLDSETGPLR